MQGSSNARRLRGIPLSPTAPTDGQGLLFDAASGLWVPSTLAGTGNVGGQASSVDGEIALFSGSGGKTIARATGTGFAKVVSGVWQAPSATIGSSEISPLVLQYAEVTLTAAQVKAVRATPIQLIAAPGANSFIVLQQIVGVLDYQTTPYAGGQVGHQYLSIGYSSTTALINTSAATILYSAFAGSARSTVPWQPITVGDAVDLSNQPVYVKNTGNAEFTTGDSPVHIHIWYVVLPANS